MSESLKVRLYEEGDEQRIFKLINPQYGISAGHLSHWFWEHKENPMGSSHMVIAEEGKQIVGYGAFTRLKMKLGENIVTGSHGGEVIVHPDFRRKGVYSEMAQLQLNKALERGISLTYGFPNPINRKVLLKHGFTDICDLLVLVKCRDAYTAIIQKYPALQGVGSLVKVVSTPFNPLFRAFFKTKKAIASPEFRIKEISFFDRRFNDLWKRASNSYKILVARDQEYLNWRFSKKPGKKYIVLSAEKKAEVLGYLVIAFEGSAKPKVGHIADIFVTTEEPEVEQELLGDAVKRLTEEGARIITCSTPKHSSLYKTLKKNGFIQGHSRHLVMALLYSGIVSESFFKDPTNWYITLGDSDLI